ncbi:MAG: hypothetical protein J5903_00605, partial [Clostridia bacterium]|nr:hypothetical protein [Clostridia bacterium]
QTGGSYGAPRNPSKYMLYSDPFNDYLDSLVQDGVAKEYADLAVKLSTYAKHSKYAYIFESTAALCEVLSVKYDLGARTRNAYEKGDKAALSSLVADYAKTEKLLEKFYYSFRALWYKDNKPHGFDVQDLRLGGLKQRIASCRERIEDYVSGKIKNIPELEEKLLDYYGKGEPFDKETPTVNGWTRNASVNVI